MKSIFLRSALILLLSCIPTISRDLQWALNSLDLDSRQMIMGLIEEAKEKKVSVSFLERKLMEGVSKAMPGQLIYKAMKKRLEQIHAISSSDGDIDEILYRHEKKISAGKSIGKQKYLLYGQDVNTPVKTNQKIKKQRINTSKTDNTPRGIRYFEREFRDTKNPHELGSSDETDIIKGLEKKQHNLDKKLLMQEKKNKTKIERNLKKLEKNTAIRDRKIENHK